MTTNGRAEVRPSATTDDDAQRVSYQRVKTTRQLLNQALTALDAREQQRALSSLAAATNRLGDRTWPDEHPGGEALAKINNAIDEAMIDKERNRSNAKHQTREALQLLDAVEEFGEDTAQDDEEVEELLTDGGDPEHWSEHRLRADDAWHDVAQYHLHEFGGGHQ